MIDDYQQQISPPPLPPSQFGQGATEGSFDLTPEGGLSQKDVGTVGLGKSFEEPNLMYQTEDFDLAPSVKPKTKPKVKTQEFEYF